MCFAGLRGVYAVGPTGESQPSTFEHERQDCRELLHMLSQSDLLQMLLATQASEALKRCSRGGMLLLPHLNVVASTFTEAFKIAESCCTSFLVSTTHTGCL